MEDETTRASIIRVHTEIDQVQSEIKTVNEAIQNEVEQSQYCKPLEQARLEVKDLLDKLKLDLAASRDYTQLAEEKAELQFKLRDLKEIMSANLQRYKEETKEEQVPLGDGKKARRIIHTAKLGTKDEFYQEPMRFDQPTGNRSYEISDGKTKTTIDKNGTKTEPVKPKAKGGAKK